MTALPALLTTVMVLAPAADAELCARWRSVDVGSELHYIATFEGAPAPGIFHGFSVCFDFDPGKPQAGRLEVWVDTTSADMDSADINEAIAEAEWFDSAQFPRAHFVSTAIEATGDEAFLAHGRLTLKGVEREVNVPFSWRADGATGRMGGELRLNRTDFNIGTGDWAEDDSIGFEVTIRFAVTLECPR